MSESAAPIVIGVNGSFVALDAACWAGAVAESLGASLHILTAMPYLGHNPTEATAAIRAMTMAEHRDSADLLLEATKEAVLKEHPGLTVTTESVDEPADEALAVASRTARLLVLGCDDVNSAGAVLLGSTTLATLTRAVCPTVAWRGSNSAPTGQPIVAGVGGSAVDGGVLGTAFELADMLGAPLRVVHSLALSRSAADIRIPLLIDWNAVEAEQWHHLNAQVEPWRARYPDVKLTLVSGPLKSSRALLEHSDDAQMVVIGSRRRGALARSLFGSTSLNLLHHSTIPVVLCPFSEEH